MNTEQVIEKITAKPKYYLYANMSQTKASNIIKRYREGRITINKLKEFLNEFGYELQNGMEWKRKTKQ